MNFNKQVIKWIESDKERMAALEFASLLKLDDWCLAAGFVRNLIWDKLHGKTAKTPLNDIDLIYFNAKTIEKTADLQHEARLKSFSNLPWSVKNQARMHVRNNDQPYCSTSDAMTFWVEIETAVGATFTKEHGVRLITPFGLAANFNNTITLNPKRPKPDRFLKRIDEKKWCELWPNFTVIAPK